MLKNITINGVKVEINEELIKKYDQPGPRYTSYPTAPVWTDKFGPNDYAHALRHPPAHALSLYFHIPFCDKRCLFCGCSTIATTQHGIGDRYVQALKKEISLVSNYLDKKEKVAQLHYGGGTPTYLSCKQLEELWKAISDNFQFSTDAEIAIEIDPRVTTIDQLKLLAAQGFNRISMGIQDFSPLVQETIGRIEPFEHVEQTIERCRKAGFKSVNIDLVYGLPNQTLSSFKATVEKIIKLSPDRIACFNFAYVPWMMPHQRKLPQDKISGPMEKFAIFCQTIEQLCNAGYDFIGMDHFAKRTNELAVAARKKTLWRNFQGYTTKAGTDLIGFGLTSISDIAGHYAQNEKKLSKYYEKIEAGILATVKGWKLSEDDMARRKIIRELFCNGSAKITIEPSKHRTIELEKDGLIKLSGNKIQVTPLGRLFIRNIAMAFDKYLNSTEAKFSKTI